MKRILSVLILVAMCFSIVGCVKTEEKEIKSMTFKVPDTYNKVRDDEDIKDGDYGWEVKTKSYKKDKNKYVLVTYAIYDFHKDDAFDYAIKTLDDVDKEVGQTPAEEKNTEVAGCTAKIRLYKDGKSDYYVVAIDGPDGVYTIRSNSDDVLKTVKFE